MKGYRPYIPVMIFSTGFILAFIMTVNHQWLHGGYEGLLYHSMEPLFNKGNLSVGGQVILSPGQVTLSSDSDHEPAEIMAMTFTFDGVYDVGDESGRIDIEVRSAEGGEGLAVASLVRQGDSLTLMPENVEEQPVDLSDILASVPDYSKRDLEALWSELYSSMEMIETEAMDRRIDGGHLPKEMVAYRLDLMTALSEQERGELKKTLGNISTMPVLLSFLVDHQGELACIELETEFGGMILKGYCLVE